MCKPKAPVTVIIEPKSLVALWCGAADSVENTTGKSRNFNSRTWWRIVAAKGQANVREILSILIFAGSVFRAAPMDDMNGILFF